MAELDAPGHSGEGELAQHLVDQVEHGVAELEVTGTGPDLAATDPEAMLLRQLRGDERTSP